MNKQILSYWQRASENYQKTSKIDTRSAHYGPVAPRENELRLLGNVKRKKILEIGCGGGQCSIAFAKQGAQCTALDFSSKQLSHARKLAEQNHVSVSYIQQDIQKLSGIKSRQFDIVFSAFALQYVPDLTTCFKEVNRVLKPNGLFVFSLDHPFYQVISNQTGRIERSYKKSRLAETDKQIDGKKMVFVMYTRTISDIFESLTKAGFQTQKILEPHDLKHYNEHGKYWKNHYPKKLVKLIPATIIFKAKKAHKSQ